MLPGSIGSCLLTGGQYITYGYIGKGNILAAQTLSVPCRRLRQALISEIGLVHARAAFAEHGEKDRERG